MRILRNAVFFKTQNPRKVGTLCTLKVHLEDKKNLKTFKHVK